MRYPLLDFVSVAGVNDGKSDRILSRRFHSGESEGKARRGRKSFLELARGGLPVVGHGTPSPSLDSLLGECGSAYIDTECISRILVPTLPSFEYENVCLALGIPARGDEPFRTGKLFMRLMESASSLDRRTILLLTGLLSISGKTSLAAIMGRLADSAAGRPQHPGVVSVESNLEDVRGDAGEVSPLRWPEILGVLGRDGTLASVIENYEERQEQLDMAKAVAEAVNSGKILLAEAGTGTGKSFAYLVPTIFWAVNNRRRVVVSTNTKNLQDQLYEKDLPSLERAMPLPFTYRILKGRQNYLCMERLYEVVNSAPLLIKPADAEKLLPLITWSSMTETGDIAENRAFDLQKDNMIWQKVSCDHRYCPARDDLRGCFLSRARKNALESHVVIVNHALLLNDILMDRTILGKYECLVIDEAHNLEKVAHEQLGRSVNYFRFHRFFDRVFGGEGGGIGLLEPIPGGGYVKSPQARQLILALTENVKKCRRRLAVFFTSLNELLMPSGAGYVEKKRFKPGDRISSSLTELGEAPLESLRHIQLQMARLYNALSRDNESGSTGERSYLKEIRGVLEELTEMIGDFEFLSQAQEEDWVYWIQGDETPGRMDFISIRSCPIDVAPFFKEMLYESTKTVIISSATISIAGDFSFSSKVLGVDLIEPQRVINFCGGTSFPLDEQVLLLLPTFIPSVLDERFVQYLPQLLERAVKTVRGGTLVLFTSREWLKRTQSELKRLLVPIGVRSMAQGEDGSREVLLERFRAGSHSVLLGTDSFWEGVDVPGEALQLVIIVRLPFPVPSEPITEAISERMSMEGINPFTDYSLPRAAIRLKQGFGRLIRNRLDRGAVLVLDKRIVEKRYGAYLREALGVKPVVMDDSDDLFCVLGRWCESSNDIGCPEYL
ncbi:MAG: ATP-dependent DNA helicase [Candidatus Glassbacteria bacterium]